MPKNPWQIPPSVLSWLGRVPKDGPVAMLLRHSVRPPLPENSMGSEVSITEDGERIARELGQLIGPRLKTVHASPVLRCVQTGEALLKGAESTGITLKPSRLLGEPSVFVLDGILAMQTWVNVSFEGLVEHMVAGEGTLPGLAHPEPAARYLVQTMLAFDEPGVHVFVTHDAMVLATAARLLGKRLGREAWPWFLEAAFFWRDREGIHAGYREHHGVTQRASLCELTEHDVVELARREILSLIGSECRARFFLAGKAFESLLTGRPPEEFELWPASEADRVELLAELRANAATALPPEADADVFERAERRVKVSRQTEPSTLEERLARRDPSLAVVGVEHRPGPEWRAVIFQPERR